MSEPKANHRSGRRRGRRGGENGSNGTTVIEAGVATNGQATNGTSPETDWLAALDALAAALAPCTTRAAVVDEVARHTMAVLPVGSVVIDTAAEADGLRAGNEGDLGTTRIPIAIGPAVLGTLEATTKPGAHFGPRERALLVALGRLCAFGLDRLPRPPLPGHAPRPTNGNGETHAAFADGTPETAPGHASDVAPSIELVKGLDRVAADLRALTYLAQSAALPPPGRVDDLERRARAHLDELRARIDPARKHAPSDPSPRAAD